MRSIGSPSVVDFRRKATSLAAHQITRNTSECCVFLFYIKVFRDSNPEEGECCRENSPVDCF